MAYWRAHQAHLAVLEEHRGTKLVALATRGTGVFHSNARIPSLAKMEGMKNPSWRRSVEDVGSEFGLVGIQNPSPKVCEILVSVAADTIMMPLETCKGSKLTEAARIVFEMPGVSRLLRFSAEPDRFNSPPHEMRHALEDHIFGYTASRMYGAVWDEIDEEGRAVTMETQGKEIVVSSDADASAYAVISQRLTDKVLGELSTKGVDAAAAESRLCF